MTAPIAAIRRWEELGQQLQKTLTAYLNSCLALEVPITHNFPGASELASKIDDKLPGFDNLLTRRLNSARSSLVRTRNKLKAPIFRLSEDVLSSIFHMIIDNVDTESSDRSTRDLVITRYRHLHTLIAVCSTWRNIILSHGKFWSVVPVIPQKSDRFMATAAQLSLERSNGSRLQLVAELFTIRPDISSFVLSLLTCYGYRLRTVNLRADSGPAIVQAVGILLASTTNSLGSLTNLSLCYHNPLINRTTEFFNLSFPNDSEQAAFNRMLGSLRVLKLRAIKFSPIDISFVSLTHLRLQDVRLESNAQVAELLQILSSTSQIRILELISVSAYGDEVALLPSEDFPVSFPALCSLYLEHLFQDTLNLILGCVAPGKHRVTLYITNFCLGICHPGGVEHVGLTGLDLQDFKIHTLMLTPRFSGSIDGGSGGICTLLELMPNVTSLHIDGCHLTSNYLNQLIRRVHPDYTFPNLTELRISRCQISPADLELLKTVVASHSIGVLGLGIGVTWSDGGRTFQYRLQSPHERFDLVRNWLLDNTSVIWLPDNYSSKSPAPEFDSGVW